MNEEKQTEYEKDVKINIDGVEINVLENKGDINKIYFHIGDKQITWKPKIDTEEYREGIKVTSRKAMTIDKLPQKVKDIAKICNTTGKCTCILEYTKMTTENGVYYFITSESQLDRWVIEEDKPEETKL